MYLDILGTNALHSLVFPSHTYDKATLHMAHPSMHQSQVSKQAKILLSFKKFSYKNK